MLSCLKNSALSEGPIGSLLTPLNTAILLTPHPPVMLLQEEEEAVVVGTPAEEDSIINHITPMPITIYCDVRVYTFRGRGCGPVLGGRLGARHHLYAPPAQMPHGSNVHVDANLILSCLSARHSD